MMRVLLSFLISIAIISCAHMPTPESDNIAYIARTHVNKIFSPTGGHCTSFYAEINGKIRHLSAGHCCVMPMDIKGEVLQFLKVDQGTDVCELSMGEFRSSGIKLAKQNAEITDKIHAIGFPLDNELTISSGRVIKTLRRGLGDTLVVRTNANVFPGNSGGPVVNDKGELVGVVSQTNGFWNGHFVPLDIVLKSIQ